MDQADLPPVEYLIMEVLGSRERLGENHWTFPSKMNSWLASLEKKGLLQWKAGIVPLTSLAWLTDEGRQVCLSEEYLLTRKFEDCAGQSGLPQVQARLREQYGTLVTCASPDCEQRFIPASNGHRYCTPNCRRRDTDRVRRGEFTQDMVADLLQDARAGNIRGWQ